MLGIDQQAYNPGEPLTPALRRYLGASLSRVPVLPVGDYKYRIGTDKVTKDPIYQEIPVTKVDLDAMVARFQAEGKPCVIDQDHDASKNSVSGDSHLSLGDVIDLEVAPFELTTGETRDCLWAVSSYTDACRAKLTNREIRFVSPHFVLHNVDPEGKPEGARFKGYALTNNPHLTFLPEVQYFFTASPEAGKEPKMAELAKDAASFLAYMREWYKIEKGLDDGQAIAVIMDRLGSAATTSSEGEMKAADGGTPPMQATELATVEAQMSAANAQIKNLKDGLAQANAALFNTKRDAIVAKHLPRVGKPVVDRVVAQFSAVGSNLEACDELLGALPGVNPDKMPSVPDGQNGDVAFRLLPGENLHKATGRLVAKFSKDNGFDGLPMSEQIVRAWADVRFSAPMTALAAQQGA